MSGSSGPSLSIRRNGACDFETLDQKLLNGPYLFVGSGTIGKKVQVDCKYLWQQSKWGVLGSRQHPAGIIYIDISITQPEGYWLECASVYVTMSEDDDTYALQRPAGEVSGSRSYSTYYDVQMTEHYGPQLLMGPETSQKRDKSFRMLPRVLAGGVELGGMGYEHSKSQELSSRWVFKGSISRPQDYAGFKTLHWEFRENHLDYKRSRGHEYHTGFAFEHQKRPLYMRLEVEGKLRSKSLRLKNQWLSFSSSRQVGKNPNVSTLTRMAFEPNDTFNKTLDFAARGLNEEMQQKNLQRTALEIPESKVLNADERVGSEERQDGAAAPSSRTDDAIVSALLQQLVDEQFEEMGRQPTSSLSSSSMIESVELEEEDQSRFSTTSVDKSSSPSPPPSVATLVGQDDGQHDKLGHLHEQFERLSKFPGFTVLLKIFCFIVTYLM
mgnify:CR=1 FL=1